MLASPFPPTFLDKFSLSYPLVHLLFYPFKSFSLMVFHWSLRDSKSLQVSTTLLSILVDLNTVVWMFSTCPHISKSFSPCTNHLVTVPSAPITNGITVTLMFHSFFSSLARSRYLYLFSLSFTFTLWSAGTAKSAIRLVFIFFLFVGYYWVWSPG